MSDLSELREAVRRVSPEEFTRLRWSIGPKWSRMYFSPETPEQHSANELEYKEGMRRVVEHINSEIKPEGD